MAMDSWIVRNSVPMILLKLPVECADAELLILTPIEMEHRTVMTGAKPTRIRLLRDSADVVPQKVIPMGMEFLTAWIGA
jgi:hypothetical protein